MKLWKHLTSLTLLSTVLTGVSPAQKNGRPRASDPGALPAKIRRFSPTLLTANTSRLSAKDRLALRKIVAAAKLLDPLFLRQVWAGNEAMLLDLFMIFADPIRLTTLDATTTSILFASKSSHQRYCHRQILR